MITKEDKFLQGYIQDKILKAENDYILQVTTFLDLHEQNVALHQIEKDIKNASINFEIFGGYDDAMRRLIVFFPDYIKKVDFEELIALIKVEIIEKNFSLSHRDFLGAFLGLGLKRELMGDIIIKEYGADIIISREIFNFVKDNFKQISKYNIKIEEKKLSDLEFVETKRSEKRGTIASNRLDNIISECFNFSRTKAQELIQQKLVFVNYIEKTKNETTVEEESIIVVRGYGKIKILNFSHLNKKNKLVFNFIKF